MDFNIKGTSPEKIVIKLSGSIFNFNTEYDTLAKYAELFVNLNQRVQLIIVAGGGNIARYYIELGRALNSDEATLDAIGIDISRLNGRLLLAALGHNAYPEIPKTLEEIAIAMEFNKIIVTGGLHPGQSTNATSALIC